MSATAENNCETLLRVSRQVETRRNYLIPIALPHLSLLLLLSNRVIDIISNLYTDTDTCNFYLESYLVQHCKFQRIKRILNISPTASNRSSHFLYTYTLIYKQRITILGMLEGVFGCRVRTIVCTKCGEQKQSKALR